MGRVFVSYHASDGRDIAHRLVAGLERAGFQDCYAYNLAEHGPPASYEWRQGLRSSLLGADGLLVVTTKGSMTAEWCTWEIAVFRERKPDALVVEFVSSDLEQGRALLNHRQTAFVNRHDPSSMDSAVATAVRLLSSHGVSTAPGLTSPFPGLRTFEEGDASIFFGRQEETEHLARPLLGSRRSGTLAVVGPSGAGKSSLVRAGLVPRLRRRPTARDGSAPIWLVLGPFRPEEGVTALGAGIAEIRGDMGLDLSTAEAVEEFIAESPDSLDTLLSHITRAAPEARVLIVLDQAEELLWGEGETRTLVSALISATHKQAWLVYTVRADLLDALMTKELLAPLVRDDFLVKPLSRADLPQIINGPLDRLGWRMSDEALGRVVEDAGGEALPLLAFALDELWRHVNPDGHQEPRIIGLHDYLAAGCVQDVLRVQAEEAFGLARSVALNAVGRTITQGLAEQRVLRALRRLVSVDASGRYTRRAVQLGELPPDETSLLEPFVKCRVLTTFRTTTRNFVQVAHESLFLHWPRLRAELDQERDSLRARQEIEDLALVWQEAGHPHDQLLPPSRLMRLLSFLSPPLKPDGRPPVFKHRWPELLERLIALQLSDAALRLMEVSLQRNLEEEVARALVMVANPQTPLRMLVGAGSAPGGDVLTMLLHAPDITSWERALRRVLGDVSLTRTLLGHEQGVWGVAWSPDDSKLVTGSKDGSVRVWDINSGTCLARFTHGQERRGDNPGWVRSVDWSPQGDLIASAATDETVRLWSWTDRREANLIPLPNRPWSVRFDSSGDHVLVACADGRAYLHAVRGLSREPVRTYTSVDEEGQPVRLWDADLSADGRFVATAREDGGVDLHARDTLTPVRHLVPPGRGRPTVRTVRFSPHANYVATGDQANNAHVIQLDSASRAFQGHRDQVRRVSWSPSGLRVATASADETVRVWTPGSVGELLTLADHGQGVCDVAWSHAGDRLASASDDGKTRVWKVGAEPKDRRTMREGRVTSLAWSAATHRLIVGIRDDVTRADGAVESGYLDFADRASKVYRLYAHQVSSLAWSPDGRRLLVGSLEGTAFVLPTTDTRPRWEPNVIARAHDGVTDAQWSSDGRYIAVVSRDRTWRPRLYDRDGRPLDGDRRWRGHHSFLRAVAWHPEHPIFAVAGQDNMVTLNALDQTVAHWETDKVFTSLAWSPDGERLAVGCTDGTVIMLGTELGSRPSATELLRLYGHSASVNSLAWSPQGATLLSASDDGTARTWHPGTGGQLTVARADRGPVVRALWTGSEDQAVTAATAGSICLWDLSDGPARPLSAPECDVHTLIKEARRRAH
ncbi:nSTAND1 domain-containing NTPase [Streptomyces canus]|uniref:nSTAND1 domain-containing NTPase n=1 Tax=Streptomyces canus TaxID=58343 RepID=UPI003437DCD5